tara:strand:+ start:4617 stop:4766 length:150 start_codon:yes stop_codon:yes gene_type:complete
MARGVTAVRVRVMERPGLDARKEPAPGTTACDAPRDENAIVEGVAMWIA